jgi:hypothetical protein
VRFNNRSAPPLNFKWERARRFGSARQDIVSFRCSKRFIDFDSLLIRAYLLTHSIWRVAIAEWHSKSAGWICFACTSSARR